VRILATQSSEMIKNFRQEIGRLALRLGAGIGVVGTFAGAYGQHQVTTYHNDNARTGLNSAESLLTPLNVNPKTFGLLFKLPVDGQVYAQPLYLQRLAIPGKGTHNVVFVATEHNSVYAFDADNQTGTNSVPLWQVNLGPSFSNGDTGSWDINPEIGITSTPVISTLGIPSTTPTLYVVSKTKVSGNYFLQVHALDATTGKDLSFSPVTIQGSVPGTGEGSVKGVLTFNPLIQNSRAALLLIPPNSTTKTPTLHVTLASHGDNGPYHGWDFIYDASNLTLQGIVNTTPNALNDKSGYPIAAGGIWQSGFGPASDGSNIFYATGNGWFDPKTKAYGDSIVRLQNRGTSVADYFTPSNQLQLDDSDADLGSGGVLLLPQVVGTTKVRNLLVQCGKEGTVYLLNTTNLGKYGATDNVIAELPHAIGGVWGGPAYWNGNIYYGPSNWPLVSIPVKNAGFPSGVVSQSPTGYGYPGPTPSVSSYGNTNGIVWAIQGDGAENGGPAYLHAYDATNLAVELYSSAATQNRDALDGAIKFSVPTIVNGKVYVGTASSVGVFGLGKWAETPVISKDSGPYPSAITVTATDATKGATIYYTTDGTVPTTTSLKYTKPITVSSSVTLKFRAIATDYGSSAIVQRDYLIGASVGTGTGLTGNYFDGQQLNPTGTPTASEIDPTINFTWNGNSPIKGVQGSNWAADWTGQIQALTTGTYTITTNSDDGVQVYIDGVKIIDDYGYHAPTFDSGTVQFVAGRKYKIEIKYFQGGGGANLNLYWQSKGLPQQIIQTSQLYPK
jgi:PA14 domain/Chitobiase/beta-hexosaminidase C-terminal domain